MRNSRRAWDVLLAFLLAVILLTPLLSWMLSAVGLVRTSMISAEGLRWFASNFPEAALGHWFTCIVSMSVALGAARGSGMLSDGMRHKGALAAALAVAMVSVALGLMLALHPDSPLLSVTGRLRHGTFVHALLHFVSLSVLACALAYGLASRHVATYRSVVSLLAFGLARYARAIFACFMLSFLCQCWKFIITGSVAY